MRVVAGVDAHKMTHSIVFVDGVGSEILQLVIAASPAGYEQAIERAQHLGDVVWGIEGTGSYGRAFAEALLRCGAVVYEVPGILTKRHRARAARRDKSDTNDARAIAQAVLREPERLPRFENFDQQEAVRLRSVQRDHLVVDRTRAINRLRGAALRLELLALPSQLFSERSLRCVQELAMSARGGSSTGDVLADEALLAVDDIRRLNAQIKKIDKILEPIVTRVAPELLSLVGVSVTVAADLIGHAGNIGNCRNAAAFAMRSATAPVQCSSGQNQRVRVNIGGNRLLNRSLHQMAITQIRLPATLGRTYYERKIQEGKTPRQARRCLKRQLATVVFYRFREALATLNSNLFEIKSAA